MAGQFTWTSPSAGPSVDLEDELVLADDLHQPMANLRTSAVSPHEASSSPGPSLSGPQDRTEETSRPLNGPRPQAKPDHSQTAQLDRSPCLTDKSTSCDRTEPSPQPASASPTAPRDPAAVNPLPRGFYPRITSS
ncbi:unnamed protein product [Linum trigynum]|uniref:Uncharacterized protein n=1 Tax=Linum trigynum TaxID=586398 RepID=A0AAV2EU88_9ROSI